MTNKESASDGTTRIFRNPDAIRQGTITRNSVSDYLDASSWDTSMSEHEISVLKLFMQYATNDTKFGYHIDYPGKLQLGTLTFHGLKPYHYLVEIGCGSLRFAEVVADYLKPYHYVGIDPDNCLIDFAAKLDGDIFVKHGKVEDIQFRPDVFDFAWAFSVFTHMDPLQIYTTLKKLRHGLKLGGKFLATFCDSSDDRNPAVGVVCSRPYPMFSAFPREMFVIFAKELGFMYDFIGDWNCPGNPVGAQQLIGFTKCV